MISKSVNVRQPCRTYPADLFGPSLGFRLSHVSLFVSKFFVIFCHKEQKTEDRRQRTEDGGRTTEVRGRMTEDGGQTFNL